MEPFQSDKLTGDKLVYNHVSHDLRLVNGESVALSHETHNPPAISDFNGDVSIDEDRTVLDGDIAVHISYVEVELLNGETGRDEIMIEKIEQP